MPDRLWKMLDLHLLAGPILPEAQCDAASSSLFLVLRLRGRAP